MGSDDGDAATASPRIAQSLFAALVAILRAARIKHGHAAPAAPLAAIHTNTVTATNTAAPANHVSGPVTDTGIDRAAATYAAALAASAAASIGVVDRDRTHVSPASADDLATIFFTPEAAIAAGHQIPSNHGDNRAITELAGNGVQLTYFAAHVRTATGASHPLAQLTGDTDDPGPHICRRPDTHGQDKGQMRLRNGMWTSVNLDLSDKCSATPDICCL